MNIVTSGNPHAQALLMGLLAHFTPAQRQYVLALLPPGKGRNLPAGGRGGGAFAASLTSHNQCTRRPAAPPGVPPGGSGVEKAAVRELDDTAAEGE
ncbi:hypothetical protein PLESTB_001355900 [Pleodorina starrii]|uniref:Uncharacterized protein n=1 Tax=Pleodorina starrii TaxID=330485 RepID=A0A9W6F7D2_9CHLO|nr:hypothetical protein PLESTB_001355900 [Pleodorina starrii]